MHTRLRQPRPSSKCGSQGAQAGSHRPSPGPCDPCWDGDRREAEGRGSVGDDKTGVGGGGLKPGPGQGPHSSRTPGVLGVQRTSQPKIIITNNSNNSSSASYIPGAVLCVLTNPRGRKYDPILQMETPEAQSNFSSAQGLASQGEPAILALRLHLCEPPPPAPLGPQRGFLVAWECLLRRRSPAELSEGWVKNQQG